MKIILCVLLFLSLSSNASAFQCFGCPGGDGVQEGSSPNFGFVTVSSITGNSGTFTNHSTTFATISSLTASIMETVDLVVLSKAVFKNISVTGNLNLTGDGPHSISAFMNNSTGNQIGLNYQYTTNKATSGNDTGFVINQIDTASPGTSLLQDWQVGGVSMLRVDNTGLLRWKATTSTSSISDSNATGLAIGHFAGATVKIFNSPRFEVGMHSITELGWTVAGVGAALDTILTRESAGVVNINGGLTLDDDLLMDGNLSVGGGLSLAFANISTGNSPVTVTKADYSFDCDATGGDVTFNLMSSSTVPGQGYEITTIGTGTCILQPAGGENVNGFYTYSGLNTANESVLIRANGIDRWTIKAGF